MNNKTAGQFRQQIMFNNEGMSAAASSACTFTDAVDPDDLHFPTLTVNRTMKFALRNKVPNERPERLRNRKDFVHTQRDDILGSLGIDHTKKTPVGNEFIRGVSGGERKRVSLAEVIAGQVRFVFLLVVFNQMLTYRAEPCPNVGQPDSRS